MSLWRFLPFSLLSRFALVRAGLDSAGVDGDCVLALLAADWAAPRKLARAALHHLSPACSVSRPTAHQLAAIWCQARGPWVCFRTEQMFAIFFSLWFQIRNFITVVTWDASYRCIFYQQSQGCHSLDPDGRNLGRVQDTANLWQQGVWPGGPEEGGRSWIQYEWGGPEMEMMLKELGILGAVNDPVLYPFSNF